MLVYISPTLPGHSLPISLPSPPPSFPSHPPRTTFRSHQPQQITKAWNLQLHEGGRHLVSQRRGGSGAPAGGWMERKMRVCLGCFGFSVLIRRCSFKRKGGREMGGGRGGRELVVLGEGMIGEGVSRVDYVKCTEAALRVFECTSKGGSARTKACADLKRLGGHEGAGGENKGLQKSCVAFLFLSPSSEDSIVCLIPQFDDPSLRPSFKHSSSFSLQSTDYRLQFTPKPSPFITSAHIQSIKH